MGSFEKYHEKSMDLFKKLNHKKTSLQDELKEKEDEVERLKTELISQTKEQQEIDVDPKELEEARWANIDLKIQLEEAKRREEVLKNHLDKKEKTCEHLEMEVIGLKKIEKSNLHVKFTNS